MLILAIDSTAKICSAALVRDGKVLGEVTLDTGNTHSETLLPSVEFLLRSCRLSVGDVDIFACAAGPGSFTGVRIGAATVKGLAFGRGAVTVPVGTLPALAERIAGLRGLAVPVMDARRDQVYTAAFDCTGGAPRRISEDDAISVDELAARLRSLNTDAPIYFVGDGYGLVHDRLSATLPHVADTPLPLREHSAAAVAAAARRYLEAGGAPVDAEALMPTYLRLSQAEREYNEKHKNDAAPAAPEK